MNQDHRLRTQLADLAASSPQGTPRRGYGDQPDELLRFILAEIDATILPRRLHFGVEAKTPLRFDVAARRVLAFIVDEVAQPLDDSDTAQLAQLRATLEQFVQDAAFVEISSEKRHAALDPSAVGCSATMLANHWGVDLYPAPLDSPPDMVPTFLNAIGDAALAWTVYADGDNIQTSGDEALLAHLAAIQSPDLADLDAKIIRSPSGRADFGCISLGSRSSDTMGFIFVRDTDTRAILCVTATQLDAALGLWQDMFGG